MTKKVRSHQHSFTIIHFRVCTHCGFIDVEASDVLEHLLFKLQTDRVSK